MIGTQRGMRRSTLRRRWSSTGDDPTRTYTSIGELFHSRTDALIERVHEIAIGSIAHYSTRSSFLGSLPVPIVAAGATQSP
jgi:hypothetical protein